MAFGENTSKVVRMFLISSLVGAVFCFLFLSIFAILFVGIKVVSAMVMGIFSVAAASIGAFVSGFVLAKFQKQKGMFYGAIAGGSLFFILLLFNICIYGLPFTFLGLVKFFCMILSGAFGGVYGVNVRRR
jgi:putative membrane protein (TIGR04086 family)